MDSKISAFPVSAAPLAADLVPIVSGGVNKIVTLGVLSTNLPNLGNKGITKNVVTAFVGNIIPLTGTLFVLAPSGTTYTLPNGTDGQEVKLVSNGAITVTPTSSLVAYIVMGIGSSITLVYIASKWVPLGYHNCTLA